MTKTRMVTGARWQRTGWWGLVAIAVCALLFVRHAGAENTLQLPVDWADGSAKYICLGTLAVRIGDDQRSHGLREGPGWSGFNARQAEAKERCRVPVLPEMANAEVLASLTWPDSGYTALVQRVAGSGANALARYRSELEARHWAETGGSRIAAAENPLLPGAAHQREGAWIQTVVVNDPGSDEVLLVTSGQLAPEYFYAR